MKPDRESASLLAEVLDSEPDFASEHCDFTVGDRERGGPEGVPEPESPKGYGGADIHRTRRRHHTPHAQVVMALTTPDTACAPPPPAAAPPLSPPSAAPPTAPLAAATLAEPGGAEPVLPALVGPPPEAIAEPLTEDEPDFALEHRHLSVGGSDRYRARHRD